jgi:AraC-like DNA-binding protein
MHVAGQRATSEPLIASVYAAAALDYVRGMGRDVDGLIRRFSLPEPAGPMRALYMTVAVERQLTQAIAAQLGDPCFGLRMARIAPRGAFGVFEFAARMAPSLHEALDRIVDYTQRSTPPEGFVNDCFSFEQDESGGVFSHRPFGDPATLLWQRSKDEFLLGLIVRVVRDLLGEDWSPRRVAFASAAPPDPAPLRAYFRTEVVFDRPEASLWFDRATLDRVPAEADPTLLRVLEDYASTLAPPRIAAADPASRVREYLRERLVGGPPSIDEAATALRMSTRTLQRRLGSVGTSYDSVLTELRRQLALLWLESGERPIAEVSYDLGYSEPRAFVRAFKRWTGTTPGRHRQRRA